MLFLRSLKSHVGKTIKKIEVEKTNSVRDGIHMTECVKFVFTDGTEILLKTDWRGNDCYISEYKTEAESFAA